MKNLGYKALLLSIDEFEYLFSLVSKSQYSIYLALLRGLYDFPIGLDITSDKDKLANMILFIGISEDGWDKLKEIEKKEISEGGPTRPLMRRVNLETTLLNFDRKNTEELIKKVLSYNRVTKYFEEDPLIPFTKDFVDYIYELTEGLPSAVKVRCAQVLDAGLADRVSLLTREYAQKVLEERGFYCPPLHITSGYLASSLRHSAQIQLRWTSDTLKPLSAMREQEIIKVIP